MGLAHRIRRLERQRGPVGCATCGRGGPGPIRLSVAPLRVLKPGWTLAELEENARERPEDFCSTCGRKRVLRVPSPFLCRGRAL